MRDPRHLQIAALAALLLYGALHLAWEPHSLHIGVILSAAVGTQWVATRMISAPIAFDPRSALISGLSLCLLLRTGSPWLAGLITVATISSKFVLRSDGRHVFNPTNFGLVLALLLFDDAWVSAGQWGSTAVGAFFFACMGIVVVRRARRSDVTIAFLVAHAALLFGRAAYLGDPWAIPLHQLESGALLLFAFFMISDPKTTPNHRLGRIGYAIVVAVGAYFVRFGLFEPNDLLYSLAAASPCVRLFDHLLPGRRHVWSQPMEAT